MVWWFLVLCNGSVDQTNKNNQPNPFCHFQLSTEQSKEVREWTTLLSREWLYPIRKTDLYPYFISNNIMLQAYDSFFYTFRLSSSVLDGLEGIWFSVKLSSFGKKGTNYSNVIFIISVFLLRFLTGYRNNLYRLRSDKTIILRKISETWW